MLSQRVVVIPGAMHRFILIIGTLLLHSLLSSSLHAQEPLEEFVPSALGGMFDADLARPACVPILKPGDIVGLISESQEPVPKVARAPSRDASPPPTAQRLRPLQPLSESESVTIPTIEASRIAVNPNPLDSKVVLASAEVPVPVQDDETKESNNEEGEEEDAEVAGEDTPKAEPKEDPNSEAGLVARINELKDRIGGDEQIDKVDKTQKLEVLNAAQDSLVKANSFRVRKAEYDGQLKDYPAELERLTADLNTESELPELVVTSEDTSDGLELDLQNVQQDLQRFEQKFAELDSAIENLNRRITEIPKLRAKAQEELEKTKANLSKLDLQEDDDSQLGWVAQRSHQIELQAQVEMLESETRRQELAGKVLPLKRDEAARQIKRLKTRVADYEREIEILNQAEVAQQAEQARLEAINAHDALKDLANRNRELTQLRSNITIRKQLSFEEKQKVEDLVKALSDEISELKDKVETAGGVTNANGMLLVESRRNLEHPYESAARIREIQTELQVVNVAVLALEEERKPLSDPLEFVKQQIGDDWEALISDPKKDIKKMAVKFAQTKRQYLDDLLNDYNQYRGLLGELTVQRKELLGQIQTNKNYIDEQALWVRNTEPVAVNDFQNSLEGLQRFFSPESWGEIWANLRRRMRSRPHESGLGFCGIVMVALMTRRLKKA